MPQIVDNGQQIGVETAPGGYEAVYYACVSKRYLALHSEKEYDAANEIGKLYNGDSVKMIGERLVYAPSQSKYGYVKQISCPVTSNQGRFRLTTSRADQRHSLSKKGEKTKSMGENHRTANGIGQRDGGPALMERPAAVSPQAAVLHDVTPSKSIGYLLILVGLGVLAAAAVVLAALVLSSISRPAQVPLPEEVVQVEETPVPTLTTRPAVPSAGEILWGDRMEQLVEGRKHWYIHGIGDLGNYVDDDR